MDNMSNYDPKFPILREMLALSIMGKLEECGFEEIETDAKTSERVFSRSIPKVNIEVQVYTTIVGQQVRSSGKDAIRVCAIYHTKDGASKGVGKARRVHRTGNIEDIVERMHQRMRITWKDASTGERCGSCGAPKFVAKSGNKVCAEICWLSKEEKEASRGNWKNKKIFRKRRAYTKR
jgi:hypothetical protein